MSRPPGFKSSGGGFHYCFSAKLKTDFSGGNWGRFRARTPIVSESLRRHEWFSVVSSERLLLVYLSRPVEKLCQVGFHAFVPDIHSSPPLPLSLLFFIPLSASLYSFSHTYLMRFSVLAFYTVYLSIYHPIPLTSSIPHSLSLSPSLPHPLLPLSLASIFTHPAHYINIHL